MAGMHFVLGGMRYQLCLQAAPRLCGAVRLFSICGSAVELPVLQECVCVLALFLF